MTSLSRISAADSRYKLYVYINKCYDAARSLFLEIAAKVQSALYGLCSFRFLLWRQKHKDHILGRSLQESTVVVAGTVVIGVQFLTVFKIWMYLLFDITAGKAVIFLTIFTGRIFQV